jgi:hypothetical protein
LDSLNNTLYFPLIFVIDGMLILWFFYLARETAKAPMFSGSAAPKMRDDIATFQKPAVGSD